MKKLSGAKASEVEQIVSDANRGPTACGVTGRIIRASARQRRLPSTPNSDITTSRGGINPGGRDEQWS
ncbi:hypothetical protein [Novipirellula rosea]|uniref:hypothetical protein n=1 Tax=Novipirellula rosea TaxID=1031540 RepID=UPI0031EC3641